MMSTPQDRLWPLLDSWRVMDETPWTATDVRVVFDLIQAEFADHPREAMDCLRLFQRIHPGPLL